MKKQAMMQFKGRASGNGLPYKRERESFEMRTLYLDAQATPNIVRAAVVFFETSFISINRFVYIEL
jgi:hypothetical protein